MTLAQRWRRAWQAGGGDPPDAAFRTTVAREERERLARDLHDSVKQQLFTLRMSTAAAEARWEADPAGARAALAEARACSERAMVEMEALLRQLRPDPLAGTSVVEALREQCDALHYRSGAEVAFELGDLPADHEIPTATRLALFRIGQEALNNVARHARARRVRVDLRRRQQGLRSWLELTVADDGRGFEPSVLRRGLGLASMETRAEEAGGRLRLTADPGGGCRVAARLPGPVAAAPTAGWGPEVEGADFLLAAGTITGSLALVLGALLGRSPSLDPWLARTPTALVGLLLLFQAALSLLFAARARRRRLAAGLDPEHPETLRGAARWHLALAWLGVLALTAVGPRLELRPAGGPALDAATGWWAGWWLAAVAAAVWTVVRGALAARTDRCRGARLSPSAAAAEIALDHRRRLPLVAGAALGLLAATALRPDPLFAVPFLAVAALLLVLWRRLRRLQEVQAT